MVTIPIEKAINLSVPASAWILENRRLELRALLLHPNLRCCLQVAADMMSVTTLLQHILARGF